MHSRLGFLLRSCTKSLYSSSSSKFSNRQLTRSACYTYLCSPGCNSGFLSSFAFSGWNHFCGYAIEQFSDDEYECEFENHKASSSVANIDEWKWKLSLLLRNEQDQEIVSRDKRDRRDFEQISNLAKRMGLHCEMYGKVVVASKAPLPNYRPDLDDKRPQREVVIPLSLQRRVEGLLQEHLDRTHLSSGKVADNSDEANPSNHDDHVNLDENAESLLDESVMEKVLQRRSLRMRNMQRAWQESPEGKKMQDFRKSLPRLTIRMKMITLTLMLRTTCLNFLAGVEDQSDAEVDCGFFIILELV